MYGSSDRNKFKQLLENCTKDEVFIFNEKLYEQIDGAPMESCVSSTLDEIFLSFHEQKWIDQCPTEFKPVFYRTYVIDKFIFFKSIENAPLFLDFLNRQHPTIKFTAELEKNNSISFLEVKVNKTEQSFDTGVFRKGTFTGLDMKFVTCLNRPYKICSSYPVFCTEVDFIRKFFFLW